MNQEVSGPLSVDTCNRDMFSLGSRFSNVRILGYGGSGVVLAADDCKTKQKVAVKKLSFSGKVVAKRALREIRLLKRLSHENVVKIRDIVGTNGIALDPSQADFQSSPVDLKHICIVQELLDADLHQLIRSNLLNPSYVKLFMYQLLRGLKYVHSANVIHRDLKPSNILIDCQQLTLKISDFGLCRVVDPTYDHSGYLTERVGTCWYMSPEQVLTPRDYTSGVDMWSAGCVFAEMLLGRPVFTGANELSQMLLILDSIHLEEEDWGRVLMVMPNKLLKNHPFRPRTPLGEKFTDIDPHALDLLEKLLTFDPKERLTARQALLHPYLAEYHSSEPRAARPLSVEYEVEPSSPRGIERLLVSEAESRHTCGTSHSPVVSACSSPRDQSSMTSSNGSISSLFGEDVQHETHTLDQILQLDEQVPIRSGSSISGSSSSSSVEDLNIKNLRRSQENLHSPQNIHNLSCETLTDISQIDENSDDNEIDEPTDFEDEEQNVNYSGYSGKRVENISTRPVKDEDKDVDEKDIAEPSLQKIVEDEEIAGIVDNSLENTQDISSSVRNEQLFVEIQSNNCSNVDSENLKEFSQVSPKNREESSDGYVPCTEIPAVESDSHAQTLQPVVSNLGARSKHSNNAPKNSASDFDEDYAKEKKLLEYENERYSKFEAECRENEKNKKRRSGRNRNNQSSDLDEMYRLPTEHLRIDRDYSNERIRHKKLTKFQRQYFAMYRDGLNELNERLKEATLDGAVGGIDTSNDFTQAHGPGTQNSITVTNINISSAASNTQTHSPTDMETQTILNNRHRELDLVNHQRVAVASIQRQRNTGDGFSSPEENPSSPRASFSAGARPKKSPRKQKAL